jgi:hypothetical protein
MASGVLTMCGSVARTDSGHDKDAFFVLARARSSGEGKIIVGPRDTRWDRDKKDKLRQGKLAFEKGQSETLRDTPGC